MFILSAPVPSIQLPCRVRQQQPARRLEGLDLADGTSRLRISKIPEFEFRQRNPAVFLANFQQEDVIAKLFAEQLDADRPADNG